jgi:predicted enzyme related to lactoylglutathione lyase
MRGAHGTFCWNELMARDVAGAKKFYADVMGWTYDAVPIRNEDTYWIAKMGDERVGGIFDISGPEYEGVPEGWMSYIAVDNVDERVKKAVKSGARVMKPAFDVPGIGRIAILMEPGGAGIGWITPAS